MGQINCQCTDSSINIAQIPKCSLYYQNMLTQFQMVDKQNYHLHQSVCMNTNKQCSKLPSKYSDLYMLLRSRKSKFTDSYYPPNLSVAQQIYPWGRLSQNQKVSNLSKNKISKFCQVIKFISKNYIDLAQKLKPIYIQGSGFAVATLWIQGNKTEVLIDDFVPSQKLQYGVDSWILLLQKAMAKVLGEYKYIQQFTFGQLFGQVTGIPYYWNSCQPGNLANLQNKSTNMGFNSFKDALKCDQMLYETCRFKDETSIFGYRKNYIISNISFETYKNRSTIIKMTVPTKQIMSLRVIQCLSKYKDISTPQSFIDQYNNLYFECFIERQEHLQNFGTIYRLQNCIYVNGIFTQFEEGTYWLYVKQFGAQSRSNIIAYGTHPVRLQQIFNEDATRNILHTQIRNQTYEKVLKFEELDEGVMASVNQFNNKIAIYFENNYTHKLMKFVKQNYFMLVEGKPGQYQQLTLEDVADKWVIILITNDNIDHKAFVAQNIKIVNK